MFGPFLQPNPDFPVGLKISKLSLLAFYNHGFVSFLSSTTGEHLYAFPSWTIRLEVSILCWNLLATFTAVITEAMMITMSIREIPTICSVLSVDRTPISTSLAATNVVGATHINGFCVSVLLKVLYCLHTEIFILWFKNQLLHLLNEDAALFRGWVGKSFVAHIKPHNVIVYKV